MLSYVSKIENYEDFLPVQVDYVGEFLGFKTKKIYVLKWHMPTLTRKKITKNFPDLKLV